MPSYNRSIKKEIFNLSNLFFFSLLLLYLGSFYPAFYNYFWLGYSNTFLSLGVAFIWFIFVVFYKQSFVFSLPVRNFTAILVISLLYHALRFIIYNEDVHTIVIGHFIIWTCIFLVLNCLKEEVFIKYMYTWHIIMLILIMIGYALLYAGKLQLLSTYPINEKGGIMCNYGFFFTKSSIYWLKEEFGYIRASGFYDEPGSLAHVILFILIYNKLHTKSKKIEWIFLLGGFLTMSMAHILMTVLYILMFYGNKKSIILILTLVIAGYFIKPQHESSGFAVWDAIYGRIGRFLSGNDASRDYSMAFDVCKQYFLTGASAETIKASSPKVTTETIWFVLAQHGAIGMLFYLLPIIYVIYDLISHKGFNNTQLKILILFLVNFAQRPYYFLPLYFLFIYYTWFNKPSNIKQSLSLQ